MSTIPNTEARVKKTAKAIFAAMAAEKPGGPSGVGSRAGGSDYLLQFIEPRVITENTLRRGFAPHEDLLQDT